MVGLNDYPAARFAANNRASNSSNVTYGGPINNAVAAALGLVDVVNDLNSEGDFHEFTFGGGVTVGIGLRGKLTIKIERDSSGEYDASWTVAPGISIHIEEGAKVGPVAEASIGAMGLLEVGVTQTFHFKTKVEAIRGLTTLHRIVMVISVAVISALSSNPASWLFSAVLISKTVDDIEWIRRRLKGRQFAVTGTLQTSGGLSVGRDLDEITEWSIFNIGIDVSGKVGILHKTEIEENQLTTTINAFAEFEEGGTAKLAGLGGGVKAKITVGIELSSHEYRVPNTSSQNNVFRRQSKQAERACRINLKTYAPPDPTTHEFKVYITVATESDMNASGGKVTEFTLEFSAIPSKIANAIQEYINPQTSGTHNLTTALATLDNGLALTVKCGVAEINGFSIDQSVSISLGLKIGVSFQLSWREFDFTKNSATLTPLNAWTWIQTELAVLLP